VLHGTAPPPSPSRTKPMVLPGGLMEARRRVYLDQYNYGAGGSTQGPPGARLLHNQGGFAGCAGGAREVIAWTSANPRGHDLKTPGRRGIGAAWRTSSILKTRRERRELDMIILDRQFTKTSRLWTAARYKEIHASMKMLEPAGCWHFSCSPVRAATSAGHQLGGGGHEVPLRYSHLRTARRLRGSGIRRPVPGGLCARD